MKKIKLFVICLIAAALTLFLFAGCSLIDSTSASVDTSSVSVGATLAPAEESSSVQELAAEDSNEPEAPEEAMAQEPETEYIDYYFRNEKLLNQHYEKHGIDMGFDSPEEYEQAASDVINNPDALYKEEAEDGDGVYYVEATNEFVVLATDGYIRTYFLPDAGKKYFDKQ